MGALRVPWLPSGLREVSTGIDAHQLLHLRPLPHVLPTEGGCGDRVLPPSSEGTQSSRAEFVLQTPGLEAGGGGENYKLAPCALSASHSICLSLFFQSLFPDS